MEIRHLGDRADVREMVAAHGLAWREAYDGVVPDEVLQSVTVDPDAAELERWWDHYRPHRDRLLVATVDGTVRGYAFFRWGEETKEFADSGEAGLKEIYVHPDFWGHGIGTALLDRGIELLPDECTALKLEVLADNEVGRGFYETRGFERVGSTTDDIGGETLDLAIYALDL